MYLQLFFFLYSSISRMHEARVAKNGGQMILVLDGCYGGVKALFTHVVPGYSALLPFSDKGKEEMLSGRVFIGDLKLDSYKHIQDDDILVLLPPGGTNAISLVIDETITLIFLVRPI